MAQLLEAAPPPQDSISSADAMRKEDWAQAARLLDGLGAALEAKPELCYARARAALELGDCEKAVSLLDGLERKVPSLAARIERLRAEAQLVAGPYAEAAHYFARQSQPDALLNAAIAQRRGKQPAEARALLGRALAATNERRQTELVATIRAERAALLEEQGEKALAAIDLRWLALEVPRSERARDADVRLGKLSPKRALTKDERAGRLLSFAEAGMVDAVEAEITKLSATPGPALGRGKVAYARGMALYNARRDYARAAELLNTAFKEGVPEPAKAEFYAARALARANDDDKAIAGYRELARRYPKTSWAEYGSYLVAKTYYADGRFSDALSAYETYLSRYGKRARYGKEAAFERAVSLLAAQRWDDALHALEQLAQKADGRELSRLLELQGAALAGAGQSERAIELFKRASTEQPLGFAALVARARLERMGAPPLPPLAATSLTPPPPPLAVELPEPVALLRSLGLDREAEAELLTRERDIQSRHASRGQEALCSAYGSLDVAGRRYQIGQSAVDGSVLKNAPSASTLWQWECIYPRPHQLVVHQVSVELGVSEALLWGVMRQESGFRPDVVSPAQAIGLMQLIPPTAERVAKELSLPFDPQSLRSPAYNLKLGSYYLKKLLAAFDGNVALAAASYNAGPQAVFRWLAAAPELPLDVFVARIPYDETQGYVERVIGNLARYQYVEQGEAGIPRLALELPRGLKAPQDLY